MNAHLPGGWPFKIRRFEPPPCGEQALPLQTRIGCCPEAPGYQRSTACEILRRQEGYHTPQQLIRQPRKVATAFIPALHFFCSSPCVCALGMVRLLTAWPTAAVPRPLGCCAHRLQSLDPGPVNIFKLFILQLKRADAPEWTVVHDGRQLRARGARNFTSRLRRMWIQARTLKIRHCPTNSVCASCGHRLRAARAGMIIPLVARDAIVKTLP